MGIPDHLTCLLRNLYAGQEATVRTGYGTTDGSKLGKEYVRATLCSLQSEETLARNIGSLRFSAGGRALCLN